MASPSVVPSSVTSALVTSLPHSTGPEASKPVQRKKKYGENRTPLRFRHPEAIEGESSSDSSDADSDGEGSTTAVDSVPEDDYVRKVLSKEKPLPPITLKNWYKEINFVSTAALTIVPVLAIYGALTTELQLKTFIWAVVYYFMTGLGITAGYHRLWAHRSYTASRPLQYFLALCGSGAVEGSIKWWARGHRAHHRYTDTDLDPYSAHKGLLWSHVGWMIVKPRRKPGVADVSDLSKNEVVKWQHRWYLPLIIGMGFVFPTVVAGLGWGDWRGGYFFAGAARLLFVHHSTFCVNSLAHWLGDQPFDNKNSPRDHVLTALVTIGEGYHNMHHQFPADFRNAIKWYQYDPTKWFIYIAYSLGLASALQTFPDNEIVKGQLAMKLSNLADETRKVEWAKQSKELPVISWDEFQEASKTRELVVVSGFVHDVSSFLDRHPGGRGILKARLGKDATTAFHGGVYQHSNGANNLLAMMRVGCIDGGYEVEHMKKYSDIIESLNAGNVGLWSSDVHKSAMAMPTTAIKSNADQSGVALTTVTYEPDFDSGRLTGGLSR